MVIGVALSVVEGLLVIGVALSGVEGLLVIGYWLLDIILNSPFPIPNSQFPITHAQFPIPNSQFPIPNSQFPIKKNRLAVFHSAYLNQCYNGSPQRRLTSAFDLVFYQVGTVGSDLKFLGTSPVYCCPNILIPES